MPVTPKLKRWIWKTRTSRPAWATRNPVSKHTTLTNRQKSLLEWLSLLEMVENNFGESFEYIRTFFSNRERTKT